MNKIHRDALAGSDVRLECVLDSYDLLPNEWVNEIYGLTPYRGQLFFQNQSGVQYAFNPRTKALTVEATGFSGSGMLIFKDKLYVGSTDMSNHAPRIDERDKNGVWAKRCEGTPGDYWIQSFGVFGDDAYASCKTKILKSSDGVTWTLDHTVVKTITVFHTIGSNLYAFEGEPDTAPYTPSRIYKKTAGVWSLVKTCADVKFFICETGKWSNCVLGGLSYVGGYEGKLYRWDETKLVTFLETPQSWLNLIPAIFPQVGVSRVGAHLFFAVSSGSGEIAQGKFYCWDGLQLLKLLELPFNLLPPIYFDGRLYFTAHTPAMGGAVTQFDRSLKWGEQNKGFILSLPWDIIQQGKIEPRVVRVWVDKAATATLTYNSDDDLGVVIPCFGYKTKTIYAKDTTAATLTVQADMDGTNTWEDFPILGVIDHSLSANVMKRLYTDEGAAFLRLKVVQGAADGILNVRVVLEP